MNETDTNVVSRPVFLDPSEKLEPRRSDRRSEKKRDKKSLLVFFSFIAALALLVALNMK